MTTRVLSSAGTACITPSRISFLFPFQKANSERCTLLRVSLRPIPSLAVTQRDGGHEPRPAPLLRRVPGGILEHQFLGVGVLAHGLKLTGQVIEKQLVHPEQLRGGVVPVGHDQGLHQLPGGAVLKHDPLGDGGKASCPGLEDQDAGRPAGLPLPLHRIQQHLLGRLGPQGGDLPLLGADLQKLRDVYLRIPQSRHHFVSFRIFLINFRRLDILKTVIV